MSGSQLLETAAGLRRLERYTYASLHWGYLPLPALAVLLVLADGTSLGVIDLAWVALSAVAGWAALVVLHTRLRELDDLGPSPWDRLFLHPDRRWPRTVWVSSTVLLIGSSPWAVGQDPFQIAMVAILAAVLTLPLVVLTLRGLTSTFVATAALCALAVWVIPRPADLDQRVGETALWLAMASAIVSTGGMFLTMLHTARELDRARARAAASAVTEERLRFARDLHDVFGRTLSAVALKAELAAALAERGRAEASEVMREVQHIAVAAQEEVRGLVRGYREADLADEIAGARALLEAAGITVSTAISDGPLPAPARRAFAWVVREAATNVLRHADATQVTITLARDASEARVCVDNDGAAPIRDATGGTGLTGLAERLAEIGGTLRTDTDGERFRLCASVPAEALDRLAEAAA